MFRAIFRIIIGNPSFTQMNNIKGVWNFFKLLNRIAKISISTFKTEVRNGKMVTLRKIP